MPLARVISEQGMRQFHTAETEKYAHVTYFINGRRETPYPGEDRLLVPSPKVPTYDLQPEMSAAGVTDTAVGPFCPSECGPGFYNQCHTHLVVDTLGLYR